MSELTTVARPYAKAAFDYAIEANAVDSWLEMLVFAAEVSKNETMTSYLSGSASISESQDLFLNVCEEQLKIKNWIHDQLPRTMVGDISPSINLIEFNSFCCEFFLI